MLGRAGTMGSHRLAAEMHPKQRSSSERQAGPDPRKRQCFSLLIYMLQALFIDWLGYQPDTSIMCIEPAVLVMFHSLTRSPKISVGLFVVIVLLLLTHCLAVNFNRIHMPYCSGLLPTTEGLQYCEFVPDSCGRTPCSKMFHGLFLMRLELPRCILAKCSIMCRLPKVSSPLCMGYSGTVAWMLR